MSGIAFDRSSLTGESMPETGSLEPDPAGTSILDSRCVAYAGTSVIRGAGEGIVIATGPATQTGRIAGSLADAERRRSPLQRELDRLMDTRMPYVNTLDAFVAQPLVIDDRLLGQRFAVGETDGTVKL